MFTLEQDGPFRISARPYLIKPEFRLPPVSGATIENVAGKAGNQNLENLVNGQNLKNRDSDLLLECDTQPSGMWQSSASTDVIEFDLGGPYELSIAQIWNYNHPQWTGQGLARADVSVWTEAGGWKTVLEDVTFDPAEGTDDYDSPTVLPLQGITASKIRFSDLVGLDPQGPVGLSAVRFYQQRPLHACNPIPSNGRTLFASGTISVGWTAGLGSEQQRVYVGFEPDQLTLLDTVDANGICMATLEGCSENTHYLWRVDSIQPDGTVTTGPLWSFDTAQLVSHWTFDEPSGTTAQDSGPYGLHGQVKGTADWRPNEGKVGGALMLDGQGSYVDLPNEVGSGAGPKTLALWAYPMGIREWARFMEFGNGPNRDNLLFSRLEGSNSLVMTLFDGSQEGERQVAEEAIDNETWQFLAVTFDSQGQTVLYKNGQRLCEGSENVTLSDITRVHNYIGKSNWDWDQYYHGLIGDVWVINDLLGDKQIKDLYEGRGYRPSATQALLPRFVIDQRVSETIPQTPVNKRGLRFIIILAIIGVIVFLGKRTRPKTK